MAPHTSNAAPTDHPITDIAGLVLAGGAGSRMGGPKAMLDCGDGRTLLERQVELLRDGGTSGIAVVVGAEAIAIRERHPQLPVRWVVNEAWERGQFSSLQLGLGDLTAVTTTGVLVLPVDVVGVRAETIAAIINTALANPHLAAIVPEYEDRGGHPLYLSHDCFERLSVLDPSDDEARLDRQLRGLHQVMRLPVNDAGVVRNVNTPAEWQAFSS